MLSGFQKSDLIILAGRPSMGKTALALSMARNSAVEFKHKVGIFSLEMSNQQLAERLITSEARVDSHLVRTGRLPKSEWKNLAAAAGTLSEASIVPILLPSILISSIFIISSLFQVLVFQLLVTLILFFSFFPF